MRAWDALDALKYQDEAAAVAALLARVPLSPDERHQVEADAIRLVEATRASAKRQGVVESFLAQFSLGTEEGLALMCLAEALLRTPDAATRDRLIAEKIGPADWQAHLGRSDSLFVNASTWGLMLTGKLIDVSPETRAQPAAYLRRLTAKLGEPLIRQAVSAAVRVMGEQFVLGRTIGDALARARRERMLCSFDMLGEGARTAADAERYERIYAEAIEAVGRDRAPGLRPEDGHGISVKLSALCPRYEAVQEARVWRELYPRLLRLTRAAAAHDLNLAIDAEEADRLVLSLKLVDRLAREPALGDWAGLGVVVQAYQTRGTAVIDGLAALAGETGAAADGPARQGRLLGCGDQARAGGRAAGLPRLHHQGRDRSLLPRLFRGADRGEPPPLSAIRHAQWPHAGRRPPDGSARGRGRRASAAARHGRGALCGGWQQRAAARLCAGRRA